MSRLSRTLLVEPSSHHVDSALRRRAARGEGDGVVTTLPLLESRLVRAVLPELRVADAAVARVILRTVAASLPEVAAAAQRSGLLPGDLVDALDSALASLHAADVDSEQLERATVGAPNGVRARAVMLAAAMRAHDQALHALGLVDRRSIGARLARALGEVRELSPPLEEALFGARLIELRDIAALPPARLAWLSALHRLLYREGGRLTIVAPTAHGSLLVACGIEDPRERIASGLEAGLEARFRGESAAPELQHVAPGGGEGPLAAAAARLFALSAIGERPPVEAPLSVITAAGAVVQADVAAAAVARALRAGVAPERVVIALPSQQEPIMRPLRRALGALGVPFYEGRGAPPTESLPIATLLRVLRSIDDGPRKELLIDLLRGVPSSASRSLRIRTADALAAVPGSDLRRDGAALLAALTDQASRALAEQLIALLCVPPRPTIERALAHLRAFGEALGWPAALSRHAADVVASGDGELLSALAADLSAWASLAAATDELARAVELASARELVIDWRDLASDLELALSGRHLVPGHRAGAVAIERVRDRLGLDADVLILLEAHDGALPARGAPDPLLSRALIEALRSADPRRAPPPAALTGALDLLAAIDAIGRTSREVIVIHRGVDADGRRQLPGALPIELARVTTSAPRIERAHAIPVRAPARNPHELELARSFAARAEPAASLPSEIVARIEAERVRARAFAKGERGELVASPFTGHIGSIDAERAALLMLRLGGSPAHALSVSDAERLLACPFVVFAERVLRARPKDQIADDGGARELGDLAHRALLEAYRALANVPDDDDEIRRAASESIRAVLAAAPATTALQRARRERLHDDLVATIASDRARARDEGRTFVAGEIPFGGAEGWAALELVHRGERAFVRGQIDRVDRAPHGATVIDYKSRTVIGVGGAAFFEQVKPGSAQIALYARVVRENLSPPPERVFARFVAYRDRKVPPSHVGFSRNDGSVWEASVGDASGGAGLGHVGESLVEQVSAMRNGAVPARRSARCEHCAQRVACRVPPVVLEEVRE